MTGQSGGGWELLSSSEKCILLIFFWSSTGETETDCRWWLIHVVTALASQELKAIPPIITRLHTQRLLVVASSYRKIMSYFSASSSLAGTHIRWGWEATCKQKLIALFVQTSRISTGWIWHTTHPGNRHNHTLMHISSLLTSIIGPSNENLDYGRFL